MDFGAQLNLVDFNLNFSRAIQTSSAFVATAGVFPLASQVTAFLTNPAILEDVFEVKLGLGKTTILPCNKTRN